jgi:lysophospholipase L1-like esterase
MPVLRRLGVVLGPGLVTVALLALLEGGLRLGGFKADIGLGGDPKANLIPLFQPGTAADGTPVWQRNDAAIAFRRDKPANGLRVFVLGESPVFGWPFGADLAFPRFLNDRLAEAFPDRTVEVVNCGVNGVGSWHVRRILEEEVVHHAPDVVVIYSGHGDWLAPQPVEIPRALRYVAHTRLFQLATVVNTRWRRFRYGPFDAGRLKALNDPFGYGRQRARGELTLSHAEEGAILGRFAENLRTMVQEARHAGAMVVLGTLSQNLRDFPPGASRHRPGLASPERARWATLIEEASRSAGAGDCGVALTALDAALHIDDRPALAHYERARCLDALGRYAGARTSYRLASDLDAVPLGARAGSNEVIRAVAAETGVRLVDAEGVLATASPHGLIGREWFFDHVHPTLAGQVALARAFAEALGAPDGRWPDPRAIEAARPDLAKQTHVARILVYLMLGWYDVADREVDEMGRTTPATGEQIAQLHEGVAYLRRSDPSRARTDLPEAAD